MEMTNEQQAIASELFTPEPSEERLIVRFDPNRLLFWKAEAGRRFKKNALPATILHYKEGIARTPTGGRYRYQRMTVRIGGKVWIGQTKNSTDVVRLRPASATHPSIRK